MRFLLTGTLIFAFTLLASTAQAASPVYAVGQVWKYHTRPEDPASLLKIVAIEDGPNPAIGPIYHISLIAVHLGEPRVLTVVGHLPVSSKTLDGSVTQLTKSNVTFPDVTPGVAEWRDHHGGIFTISIAEIVAIMDGQFRDRGIHAQPR